MVRLFYTLLYGATLAFGAAWWVQRDGQSVWPEVLGLRAAQAQVTGERTTANGSYSQATTTPQFGAGMMPPGAGAVTRPAGWVGGPAAIPTDNMLAASPVPAYPTSPYATGATPASVAVPNTIAPPTTAAPPAGYPTTTGAPISGAVPPAYSTPAYGPAANLPPAAANPPVAYGANYNPAVNPNIAASYAPGTGVPAANVSTQNIAPLTSLEVKAEGTERIAQVGSEFILKADILATVNDVLQKSASKIPPEQLDRVRETLIKQRLQQLIETKLVVAELKRKIPADNLKKIQVKIAEQFDESEVPRAIERSNLKTRSELEDDLRKSGSSLDREKRAFVERMLAMSWVQQNVKVDEEVTHEQMLAYYQQHAKDYDKSGRARWQQIQVRFDRYPGGKGEAYSALAQIGNQLMSGGDFSTIAKNFSQGFTADKGGTHDWTTQGSLSSDVLNRALFELPVGQLSPILEDERGFHIIKIVERQEASRTPFTEVQSEIKQKIKQERHSIAAKNYLEKLKSTTQVWTIYDQGPSVQAKSTGGIYDGITQPGVLR